MKRKFSFPPELESQIFNYFGGEAQLLQALPILKEPVEFLSKSFQQNDSVTPWGEKQRQEGYFVYFHSLNVLRMISVLTELKKIVPDFETESIVDFGSGLGSTEIAWRHVFNSHPAWDYIESSNEAQRFHKVLNKNSKEKIQWHKSLDSFSDPYKTVVASYSLNEVNEFPKQFLKAENLIILEPSTAFQTRKLMKLKQTLIDSGFEILAPCTHQGSCPLLSHSKKDWCYDRVFIERPSWLKELEKNLPMTNRTLTFSYLIASKNHRAQQPKSVARVIGDTMPEKGKTRQMVCRNEDREFLSWLKKMGDPQHLPHGSRIVLPNSYEKKGNSEIRATTDEIKIL